MSDMLKKRFQLTLSFSVTVADTPFTESEDAESAQRQRRLLAALLANEEALERYLQLQVTAEVEALTWQQWEKIILGGELKDEDVLAPVAATLDEPDARFFHELYASGWWAENTEELRQSVQTNLEDMHLTEVPLET